VRRVRGEAQPELLIGSLNEQAKRVGRVNGERGWKVGGLKEGSGRMGLRRRLRGCVPECGE
jgi:hypothetical protein